MPNQKQYTMNMLAELLNAKLTNIAKKCEGLKKIYCINISNEQINQLKKKFNNASVELISISDVMNVSVTEIDLLIINLFNLPNINPIELFANIKRLADEESLFLFSYFEASEIKKIISVTGNTPIQLDAAKISDSLRNLHLFKFIILKSHLVQLNGSYLDCNVILAGAQKILNKFKDKLIFSRDGSLGGEGLNEKYTKVDDSETSHEEKKEIKEPEEILESEENESEIEVDSENETNVEASEKKETKESDDDDQPEPEERNEDEHDRENTEDKVDEAESEHESGHEDTEAESVHEESEEDDDDTEDQEEEEENDEAEADDEEELNFENENIEIKEPKDLIENEPEIPHLEEVSEKLEGHYELLNEHASQLQEHLNSASIILQKLQQPGISPKEAKEQRAQLQAHYQMHQQLLRDYKGIFAEHKEMLDRLSASHEKVLEKDPKLAQEYQKVINEHRESLTEHEEEIQRHEEILSTLG